MYTAQNLLVVVEAVLGWLQVVSVAREAGLVVEVEFVVEVVEIQIQANLGRLRHMGFPTLEQAL
jgi:hypothetical protein